MENMTQALSITVIGMALVFLALALVMLATMALERLFRALPVESTGCEEAETLPLTEDEAKIAAVIGAALAIIAQEAETPPPATLPPQQVLTLADMARGWRAAGRLEAIH